MGVTLRQKGLVQATWERVVPISETAAGLFYGRLFEVAPELRALLQMISIAVNGLGRLDRITPAVQDLGRRHVAYGVRATTPSARRSCGRSNKVWAMTSRRRQAWAETYGPAGTAPGTEN